MLIRRSIASVVFVLTMSAVSASATPILSIGPPTTTANVGDTVELNISITGVVDLYVFGVDLLFDPTRLSFVDTTEGAFPAAGGDFFIPGSVPPERLDTVAGICNVFLLGASGDGILAFARFQVLAAGTSLITLQDPMFLDSALQNISFDVDPGSAEVIGLASAVPDQPTTMLLLASALAVAACLRRQFEV
jgi:hypothetical protein